MAPAAVGEQMTWDKSAPNRKAEMAEKKGAPV